MGRRRAFDRDKAVNTVMHEIWRQGYEASSVKAISEKLGITRSSFYNSFGSREQLFQEVLDVYAEQSPDRVLKEMGEGVDVSKALYEMFKDVCRARASDTEGKGCLAVNSMAELIGNHKEIGQLLEDRVKQNIERFTQIVQMGVDQGQIQNCDAHAVGLALQNLLIGINLMSKIIHSESELWLIAERTLQGLGISRSLP